MLQIKMTQGLRHLGGLNPKAFRYLKLNLKFIFNVIIGPIILVINIYTVFNVIFLMDNYYINMCL